MRETLKILGLSLAILLFILVWILVIWVTIASPFLALYYLFNDNIGLFLVNSFLFTLGFLAIGLFIAIMEDSD